MALKQIYASHFYEGAFSFATVVQPASTGAEPPTSYVVLVNRTLTDVLRGGALGGLKRKFGGDQVQKGVVLALQQMQEGLEKAAGAR